MDYWRKKMLPEVGDRVKVYLFKEDNIFEYPDDDPLRNITFLVISKEGRYWVLETEDPDGIVEHTCDDYGWYDYEVQYEEDEEGNEQISDTILLWVENPDWFYGIKTKHLYDNWYETIWLEGLLV
jgi:hypothetical protein